MHVTWELVKKANACYLGTCHKNASVTRERDDFGRYKKVYAQHNTALPTADDQKVRALYSYDPTNRLTKIDTTVYTPITYTYVLSNAQKP